jgi:hypothetical protein
MESCFTTIHSTSFERHLPLFHGVVSQTGVRPVKHLLLAESNSGNQRLETIAFDNRQTAPRFAPRWLQTEVRTYLANLGCEIWVRQLLAWIDQCQLDAGNV